MPLKSRTGPPEPTLITAALLGDWPLPRPDGEGSGGRGKQSRGSVLVAGGSTEVPGALILAGIAALRAGAGKLQIATCRDIAQAVAIAVPEARVISLPQSAGGDIDPSAADRLVEAVNAVPAALLGPGVLDLPTVQQLLRQVLPRLHGSALVLDAGALAALSERKDAFHHLRGNAILTPHLVEMALMLGLEEDAVIHDPLAVALRAAREIQAVVVLKGARTFIATPDEETYCYAEGSIGLATSGSGDTLGGVITGLLARGASPAQAATWGVYLHGRAGHVMTERLGKLGFLARELLAEIPPLMAFFDE